MNIDEAIYKLPMVGKTTPYLDYKSGLLFPRSHVLPANGENGNGEEPNNPNRLLFSPNDRLEQAVLGPFVMGNGSEDFKNNIPVKDADAFRFQLPNGWCIYVKGVKEADADYDYPGETLIQLNETDHEAEPVEDNTKVHLYMRPNKEGETDAIIRIVKSEDVYIEIDEEDNILISRDANNYFKIDKDGNVELIAEGTLDQTIDGNITIESTGGTVDVEASSTLTLTVGGSTITITSSSIVLDAGGVTATLSGGVMDVT
jgi:hypothetical protein